MSETRKTLWSTTQDTDDHFLQAVLAAEELENFGFDLAALRLDQIEEISEKFDLSPVQRTTVTKRDRGQDGGAARARRSPAWWSHYAVAVDHLT